MQRWLAPSFAQTVGDDDARDFGGLDPATGDEWPVLAIFKKQGTCDDAIVLLVWRGKPTGAMTALSAAASRRWSRLM